MNLLNLFSLILLPPHLLSSSDVGLKTVELINNHGYVAETHYITTEDGYILTFHRIPQNSSDGTNPKPVVLLMHGFFSSSADWVNMGPDRSLGFLLSNAGYDVWLGNSRGNAYSRNHTTLDVTKDSEQFFDFSWHELGYYDLPAAVDYILEMTGVDGLLYVGHSQGCADFLVFGSTKPEYNEKIKLATLLAPPSAMENRELDIVTVLGRHIDEIAALFDKYHVYEVPYTEIISQWIITNCADESQVSLCKTILSIYGGGADNEELENDKLPVIGSNAPSNAAIKQIIHFGQQIKNGGFSQFDYGPEKNLEVYGNERPPAYDLSKITAPVAVYYGKNDGLVLIQDVQALINKLPNVANDYLVDYEYFNHIDFIWAKDVVDFLYNGVIRVMLLHS